MKQILRASRRVEWVILFAVAASVAAQTKVNQNTEEQAIQMVLASYVETWNRHDIDAWGSFSRTTWTTSIAAAAGGSQTKKM